MVYHYVTKTLVRFDQISHKNFTTWELKEVW